MYLFYFYPTFFLFLFFNCWITFYQNAVDIIDVQILWTLIFASWRLLSWTALREWLLLKTVVFVKHLFGRHQSYLFFQLFKLHFLLIRRLFIKRHVVSVLYWALFFLIFLKLFLLLFLLNQLFLNEHTNRTKTKQKE